MLLQDHHWISKGCTVEILYGEHRSFNCVIREFNVIRMDTDKPQTVQGLNNFIVDVYGEEISFCQSWLRLIEKPGYTKVKPGKWLPNYLISQDAE